MSTLFSGMTQLSRRRFLSGIGASLALPLLPRPVWARTLAAKPQDSGPLFRLSLAEWSLHKTLFGGKMTNLEFPAAARRMGFEGVEYVNAFFKDKAKDRGYLSELKRRCDDAGVESVLIMCDGEGWLGDPDEAKRKQAVENHRKWLHAAKFLGCHSIRVNAQSKGERDEQMRLAADGLHQLCEVGEEYGLNVIVENHGGHSSDGSWLAAVMDKVDHPRCGTLPDFGNFHLGDGKWYDKYKGVEELMPYAKAVSAKSNRFGPAGNEIQIDYRRMLGLVLKAGYHGYIGVEWEGGERPEEEGIILTRDLLLRLREEFALYGLPQ
jgi:L-ribulose-5-phosphate 3-epimerase